MNSNQTNIDSKSAKIKLGNFEFFLDIDNAQDLTKLV